jgi:hypothetical protein
MRKYLLCAAILCLTAMVSAPLTAQTVSTKGVKGSASAKDPNIQSDNVKNPLHPNIAAPEKKGGPKSRGLGGTCDIHVDNHTPYYVQFYFNGQLTGVLGPWGDLYPNITQGNAQLYARAVFDNGSVMTFGPRALTCTGSDFTWTLTP